jgi:hypothetical protein
LLCSCGCGNEIIPKKHHSWYHVKYIYGHNRTGGEFKKGHITWNKIGYHKSDGYVYVWNPNHPFSTKAGYVLKHRLVMEKHLGRYLKDNEVVHHKNGIKDDNRTENLQLMTQPEHAQIHFKKDMSNRICVLCNSKETYFNKKENQYVWYYLNHNKDKPICMKCYTVRR